MLWELWVALFTAAVLISLSPGPGAANSVSDGLTMGFGRAWAGILGLQTGYFAQILLVVAGLAAVVATSPWLFQVIKWLGIAYLIYLGVQAWRAPAQTVHLDAESHQAWSPWRLYKKGFWVDLTNAKGSVFLLAFIPLFMDPQADQAVQLLIISLTLLGVDTLVMFGYALLAHSMRHWFMHPEKVQWQNRIAGSALILAGAFLTTSSQQLS